VEERPLSEIRIARQTVRVKGVERELHPACLAYPDYSEEVLAEQAADIKAVGLLHPIAFTPDGRLLDGKNRARACELAGVQIPLDKIITVTDDPIAYVRSANELRRHLTEEQRRAARAKLAALAAAATEAGAGGDRRSDNFKFAAANLKDGEKTAALAKDVSYIRAVQAHGTPEENVAIMSGKASLRGTAEAANSRAQSAKRAPGNNNSAPPRAQPLLLPSPRKVPVPNANPYVDVGHVLITKCSGPKAEWRTSTKMAQIVERPEFSVKEALKLFGRMVETHKASDRVTLEYLINGEPDGLLAKLAEHDLRGQLDEANAEIVKLRAENAELKRENADLKAKLGERDDEIARLRPRLGETGPSSSTDKQLERFESEEAEGRAF